MAENLHAGHRERVRKRFLDENGLDSFSDHQVLEFLLFHAYARCDTNEIAHKMINEFGTIANLMEASPYEISTRCKVSMNVAVLVALMPHIAKRYESVRWRKKTSIDSIQKACAYAKSLFIGKTVECFYLICLDKQYKLNHTVLMGEGTLADVQIFPREVVAETLKHQAGAVILTHNHPSGSVKPSKADAEATIVINAALRSIDVTLLDHIIVGGTDIFSFSKSRRLDTSYPN